MLCMICRQELPDDTKTCPNCGASPCVMPEHFLNEEQHQEFLRVYYYPQLAWWERIQALEQEVQLLRAENAELRQKAEAAQTASVEETDQAAVMPKNLSRDEIAELTAPHMPRFRSVAATSDFAMCIYRDKDIYWYRRGDSNRIEENRKYVKNLHEEFGGFPPCCRIEQVWFSPNGYDDYFLVALIKPEPAQESYKIVYSIWYSSNHSFYVYSSPKKLKWESTESIPCKPRFVIMELQILWLENGIVKNIGLYDHTSAAADGLNNIAEISNLHYEGICTGSDGNYVYCFTQNGVVVRASKQMGHVKLGRIPLEQGEVLQEITEIGKDVVRCNIAGESSRTVKLNLSTGKVTADE